MFHLKFSDPEEYLNEHELYEVMRSRNLYQCQFGVRSNFKKIMRNIAIAEKAERYGFDNSRKLFVQKMRERREQADKLRMITSSFKPKTLGEKNGRRKIERRYVPIPQSTTVYSEFPAIVRMQKAKSPEVSVLSGKSHERMTSKMTSLPVPPTPSVIAATTLYTDDLERRDEEFSPMKTLCEDYGGYTLSTKVMVAGRDTPVTVTKAPLSRRATEEFQLANPLPEMQQRYSMDIGHMDLLRVKTRMLYNEEDVMQQEDFVKKTKRGRGKLLESTIQITEGISEDHLKRSTKSIYDDTTEKCEAWREKNGLVSTEDVEKQSIVRRFLIDRPSKFTLSHVNDDRLMDAVDLRYRMIQKMAREMEDSFKRKSRKTDYMMDQTQPKTKSYVSLPELDTKPKPMVTLDPGGTTPDGRLILTKADYEDYLSGFKKARKLRLDKAKKHDQAMEKRVKEFKLDSSLRLREPSRMENAVPLLRA